MMDKWYYLCLVYTMASFTHSTEKNLIYINLQDGNY